MDGDGDPVGGGPPTPPKVGWDGQTLRALRRHLGVTQRALAAELGVRQQTVSEWETDAYRPRGASATLLRMVAESADFAYDPGGRSPPTPPAAPDGDAPP